MDYDTSISTAHSPMPTHGPAFLSNLEHNLAPTPLTTSATTQNPERRRKFSQVDPDSPLSSPITDVRMRDLLCEALSPIQKTVPRHSRGTGKNKEEATYFHQSIPELNTRNKKLMTALSNVE